jgi:hypothetical protein
MYIHIHTHILTILSVISSGILPGVLFDILSGIYSGILFDIPSGIRSGILSHDLSEIVFPFVWFLGGPEMRGSWREEDRKEGARRMAVLLKN